MLKNIIAQTNNHHNATQIQEKNPGSFIDSFITGSYEDKNGVITERRTYDVYFLIKEEK